MKVFRPPLAIVTLFLLSALLPGSAARAAAEEVGPPLPPELIKSRELLAQLKALKNEAHALQARMRRLEHGLGRAHDGVSTASSAPAGDTDKPTGARADGALQDK